MKIVNKKKFVNSILIIILMIVTICVGISKVFATEELETTEITYTVSEGETLWSIAKEYKQENQDIRDYIYKVKQINNMSSATIYEGQVITIIK